MHKYIYEMHNPDTCDMMRDVFDVQDLLYHISYIYLFFFSFFRCGFDLFRLMHRGYAYADLFLWSVRLKTQK